MDFPESLTHFESFCIFNFLDLVVDCSQLSIFSYFYSIVEGAEGIERELDASAKRNT